MFVAHVHCLILIATGFLLHTLCHTPVTSCLLLQTHLFVLFVTRLLFHAAGSLPHSHCPMSIFSGPLSHVHCVTSFTPCSCPHAHCFMPSLMLIDPIVNMLFQFENFKSLSHELLIPQLGLEQPTSPIQLTMNTTKKFL